jgi:hypothetical protein
MTRFKSILFAILFVAWSAFGQQPLGAGLPVDARGGPTIDPTANVIALVEANAKAAAALREADTKFNDAESLHSKELADLRARHAEILRQSDLIAAQRTREVDVLAGKASAEALATAVQTLANTSDRNAETLRNLVNATAATMAKQTSDQAAALSAQTDSLVKDINARIAELQKSIFTGVGKSSVSDPALERLTAVVEALAAAQATGAGKSEGISTTMAVIIAAAGFILTLLSIGGILAAVLLARRPAVSAEPVHAPSSAAKKTP